MRQFNPILVLLLFFSPLLMAQSFDEAPTTSKNNNKKSAIEVGVHTGHLFSAGNIDFTPGYATGLHIRHSLDYMFSWRLDLMYGKAQGEDAGATRSFKNNWSSASLQAIANLNNLKFGVANRKTNLYAFAGIGLNSFSLDLKIGDDKYHVPKDMAFHSEFGIGLSWRINKLMNIGFEHKATMVFGERGDWLDGIQTIDIDSESRGSLRDVLHYTGIRLNFNIGVKKGNTEPLYWLNPLDVLSRDIDNLKVTRVNLNDADQDGVVDKLDKERNTPEGAKVDTKGRLLDSDQDGIADHLDAEPFSPKAFPIDEKGVAQLPDIEALVNRLVAEKLKDFKPQIETTSQINTDNWYLPIIYFRTGGFELQQGDFVTLERIAQSIKDNPDLTFEVTGFTDETGAEENNLILSFKRAKTVVDYLNQQLKVNRNQLLLQWKGEAELLAVGNDITNRRVEIRVAKQDTQEMVLPENWEGQKGLGKE